jgi:hypothetical protein
LAPQTRLSAQQPNFAFAGPVQLSFPLQQVPFEQIVFWTQHRLVSGLAHATPAWSQHTLPHSATEHVPHAFGAEGDFRMQLAPGPQQTPLQATVPVAQQSPAPASAQVVPDGQHWVPQISRVAGQHSAVFEMQISFPLQQRWPPQLVLPDGHGPSAGGAPQAPAMTTPPATANTTAAFRMPSEASDICLPPSWRSGRHRLRRLWPVAAGEQPVHPVSDRFVGDPPTTHTRDNRLRRIGSRWEPALLGGL